MLVAHGKHCLLERTPFDLRKESGQFLLGSQKIPSNQSIPYATRRRSAGMFAMPAAAPCCQAACDRFQAADYTGQ